VTECKAINQWRHETRQKRGGGKVLNEGALSPPDSAGRSPLDQLPGREPSPEYAAQVAETLRRLFGVLRDPELEAVALLKMQGYRLEEIAAKQGCVPRTVQRQLRLIRHVWQREVPP
jgi:DNA-directed RNA polymerase specialized sigma24 family protein